MTISHVLRMRRSDNLGLPQRSEPSSDDERAVAQDDKTEKTLRTRNISRSCVKRIVGCVFLAAASYLASRPLFSDCLQEINSILHHSARTVDVLLRKKRGRPQDKIIYYVHISKSGGSSLMAAAESNGLSVPIRNGLVQRDWRCCGGEDSMAAQAAYAQTSRFDFVANEGDMYDAMDTASYDYVVTLRDAKSRYKSQWAEWRDAPIFFYLEPMNFTQFWKWSRQDDNFIVRRLCGSHCRGTPKFKLTREDFNYTLRRLEKFDSILFLEDFEASYRKFASKRGWQKSLGEKKRATSGVETAEDDEWDIRMGALDDALYEFAKALDGDVGVEALFQFSKKRYDDLEMYFLTSNEEKTNE